MSLICLSSRGLSDTPENYSNFFGGRGVQFPKNSEICLVGASIRRHVSGVGTVITIPAENNTMAIHYGNLGTAVNNNLFRDDVIVVDPATMVSEYMEEHLDLALKNQITISPLRYGGTSTIADATGWTYVSIMHECRNTLPGFWGAPRNLPIESPIGVVNGANSTRVTPTAGNTCWAQDIKKLWNTDNNATAGNFATQLEGAGFSFVWDTAADNEEYEGMQGGIVTGNRLVNATEPGSWVNCPNDTEAKNPDIDAYQQKIDLGYTIVNRTIQIFKNTFDSVGGYTRRVVGTVGVPVAVGDQLITILFRPVVVGLNAGWEVATKIAGAAYAGLPVIPGTDANGNFPIGHYNGNSEGVGIGINCVQFWGKNNNTMVEIAGCYDDDEANATAIAPRKRFFTRMLWGLSYISDSLLVDITDPNDTLQYDFRRLCQTRCNINETLGFYTGNVKIVVNSGIGLISDEAIDAWLENESPFCVQLPNLPITGYLGGGASPVGGATALPILGIIDGFRPDENPSNSIYEPCNENWIRLVNQDPFMVNEIQVRITDLYGVVPDNLDNPSHVWVKIRSGLELEKI